MYEIYTACISCIIRTDHDRIKKQRDELLREVIRLWLSDPGHDRGEIAALAQSAFGIHPGEYKEIITKEGG